MKPREVEETVYALPVKNDDTQHAQTPIRVSDSPGFVILAKNDGLFLETPTLMAQSLNHREKLFNLYRLGHIVIHSS